MDLTKQPPRRPSNTGIDGIVNLARMTDKARAHNEATLGEFVYGDDSGLDLILLEFLDISADDFADAADRYGDGDLGGWVRKVSDRTDGEIEAFNRHHFDREPDDEAGKKRLRDRVEKYVPGSTDIKTVFQSIELDDWAIFREADLTSQAPRTPYCRDVAGIYALARMADKARADRAGHLGDYIYNCPIDQAVLEFLEISAGDFQEAAYRNPNGLELGDWIREQSARTPAQISTFNMRISRKGPENDEQRAIFEKAINSVAPGRTDVTAWFDLLDLDDEASFNAVDLNRHPPRSPYDTSVGGVAGLARMIDKGRATLGDTLGDFWYGEDSGIDKYILRFLGISADDFSGALKACPADADLLAWLEAQGKKSEAEIARFNEKVCKLGPRDEETWTWFRGVVATLDSSRTDFTTYYELMQLSDQVAFARLKAGV